MPSSKRREPGEWRTWASVRLCARPASLRGVDLDELDEATSLDDQPFGVLELEDGSTIAFAVVRGRSGGLRLNVQAEGVALRNAQPIAPPSARDRRTG